jgi:hypothetical protein
MRSNDKHTALSDDDSIASHSGGGNSKHNNDDDHKYKHLSAEQRHKLKAGLRAAVKYKAKVLSHTICIMHMW